MDIYVSLFKLRLVYHNVMVVSNFVIRFVMGFEATGCYVVMVLGCFVMTMDNIRNGSVMRVAC